MQIRQNSMIIDINRNGILAHANQVRLQHDGDEQMYSESENEGVSVKIKQSTIIGGIFL